METFLITLDKLLQHFTFLRVIGVLILFAISIGSDTFQLPLTDGATYVQMYDALKVLPQFTGAIDC